MKRMEQLLKVLSGVCPNIDFTKETALVDDGLIDSFEMVALVSELMEAFDVELDVDDLLPENFNSAEAMWKLIRSKKG